MSLKSLSTLMIVALLCLASAAWAQTPQDQPEGGNTDEPEFRLQRDARSAASELDFEDEMLRWRPRVDQGSLEISFALGFMNFGTTLLEHDQIIYKYTQEYTYFGDVKIKGQTAFNPVIRIGGNISRWFALEGIGGMSFSDYSSSIENRKAQKNEAGALPIYNVPLGEFDAEARSLFTGQAGVNAVVYPLNISRRVESRFHPYVTGGIEHLWYSMNSNYTEDTATAWGANIGGGIRLLADENISIRFEVLFRHHSLEWTPAENFTELEEGTLPIPMEYWPEGSPRLLVEEFVAHDMNLLNWSIGVQGTF
jgi:opacity protein-like surface antigen